MRAITPKYTGKIWPNGRFGVSRVRETPFLSHGETHHETEESQFNSAAVVAHGAEATLKFRGKWESVVDAGLSNVPISHKRAKRGTRGITRHGRNLIENAGLIMERIHGVRRLSFGTVTVPNVSAEVAKSIALNWSEIVRKFVQSLRRGLLSKGLQPAIFGVTEIQEKRFSQTGIPALHLHFVFVGRRKRKSSWLVNRKNVRRWWKAALKPYVPSNTDFSACENVVAVKKSASSYLGKYMSKGSQSADNVIRECGQDWLPSAWYTITDSLRQYVLRSVLRGESVGGLLNWLCHNVMVGAFKWLMPVMIKRADGTEYSIGFAGRLDPGWIDKIAAAALKSGTRF